MKARADVLKHKFVEIPYVGTAISGIFHAASAGRHPELIAQTGFQSRLATG